MNSLWTGAAIVLLSLLTGHGQALKPCNDQSVQYTAEPAEVEKHIELINADEETPALAKVGSPQGTRWLRELDPDYTKTGPWNTTLFIGKNTSNQAFLTMRLLQHGNTLSAQWINDQLLFVEVWWGRFASSDLIVDVDAGKFVYDKFARYGQMGEPCK